MILAAVVAGTPGQTPAPDGRLVYIGTYTGPKSKGIYVSRLDLRTGVLEPPRIAAETENPSFLAIHPTKDLLYAVNEVGQFEGARTGSVSAFAIDGKTGALKLLNRQASGGDGPAHLVVDPSGRNVLVANYGGGSVAVLPVADDGSLRRASSIVQHKGSSVNPERQKEPHAHWIDVDSSGRRAYVADLGLDKVLIYRFDPDKGALTAHEPAFAAVEPGAGPRHMAFHPKGGFAYLINEIQLTITAFSRNESTGALAPVQTISTLPAGQAPARGFSTAAIEVHPSGRFLYGSNRGHDSISVFAIDESTGRLAHVQTEPTRGRTPRGFAIDPSGTFLLAGNQESDTVVVFRIDPKSGRLSAVGAPITVGAPVSFQFAR